MNLKNEPGSVALASAPVKFWPVAVSVSILLVWAYGTTLSMMYGSWFDESADMGHGIFVPLAAGYMAWLKRDELRSIPVQPSFAGLLLVLWGALQATIGTAAQWIWVSRVAFVISLVGCLSALYGFRMVRALAYPLCTLMLMIAPPTFIYERITLPLQLLASRLGEISLEAMGFSVLREGNILELVGERLSVEEACSGIRSLMSLLFLSTVYAYFFVQEKGIRAVLLVSVVPIAILCNAGRITATGIVGQFNRELAHGALHEAFGHIGLILGATLCYLLHRAIVKFQSSRWRYA
jgi:exosortase